MADKTTMKNRLRGILDPVVLLLMRLGVPPMAVTLAGLVLSFAGAFEIARGAFIPGALFVIVSGLCDTLDGSLARRAGTESVFGAFIDSTIDRISELACFGALIVYYASRGEGGRFALPLVIVALGGSFLTSYTRARAEGLGLECRVGLLERPERVSLIVLGLLLGAKVLFVVIACLAVLTVVTSLQRILHVRRLTARKGAPG
ncbi:MAG TPA: CDP-alcohol phosphatidyltransferase family protein [Candidatus Bathyarchaeia archaeon]|nr:CDP-alcohol phosphatidyltransferase family protein [Candidatus Bathyarchaeia archaeon]